MLTEVPEQKAEKDESKDKVILPAHLEKVDVADDVIIEVKKM